MSETEINIAIAEACGGFRLKPRWKVVTCQLNRAEDTIILLLENPKGETYPHEVPYVRFTTDLNAMHEAEETLDDADRVEYVIRLNEIVQRGRPIIGTGLKQSKQLVKG